MLQLIRPTICVIVPEAKPSGIAKHGAGAGVDSAWEQKKLEARKCSKMRQNPQCQVHRLRDF